MRKLIAVFALSAVLYASATEVCDTVLTRQNDKIILTYNVSSDNNRLNIEFSQPRIIPSPSSSLSNACKGELNKLKVVVFDRIGDFGNVKWTGLAPSAFMVPSDLTYSKTSDGFYILGESLPIEFQKKDQGNVEIQLPLYIAVYNKKKNYRIVSCGKRSLIISSAAFGRGGRGQSAPQRQETEMVAVTSSEQLEAENNDILSALSSIDMIKDLLSKEVAVPFSQTLNLKIQNLISLQNQITDPEIVGKINDVLRMCSDKERELKEAQTQLELEARTQEILRQKQEAEDQQKAAEEKAQMQEEKQQKRTLLMVIGGVILAIIGFIANAVFKHFRDIRNQKNLMQMQESIARQAEHEAERRSREIIRNKAHQIANQSRNKLRATMNDGVVKQSKSTKRRSI